MFLIYNFSFRQSIKGNQGMDGMDLEIRSFCRVCVYLPLPWWDQRNQWYIHISALMFGYKETW